MFSKILYAGAGPHLDPLRHFPESVIVMLDMSSKETIRRRETWNDELFSSSRLTYLFDTYLPDDYDRIAKREHCEHTFSTLLISRHYPHACVRSFLSTPFHFVGYSKTWYPKDMEDLIEGEDGAADTIMSEVMKPGNDVASYTFVDFESVEMSTFQTYAEFYECYKSK